MLTWNDLVALCEAGKLKQLTFGRLSQTAPNGRVLYMLPDVYDRFENRPWPASDGERPQRTRDRRAAMRAVLQRYVTGKMLNFQFDMKELGSRSPPDLAMKGFWEFRSGQPMTETRLFGFFACKGAFVATDFVPRDILTSKRVWAIVRRRGGIRWKRIAGSEPYLEAPWPVVTKADLLEYIEHD